MSFFRLIVLRIDQRRVKVERAGELQLFWRPRRGLPGWNSSKKPPTPRVPPLCISLSFIFFLLTTFIKILKNTARLSSLPTACFSDNTSEYLTSGIWPQTPELNNRNLGHPLSRIHNPSFPDRSCMPFLSKFLEIKARQSQSSFIYGITKLKMFFQWAVNITNFKRKLQCLEDTKTINNMILDGH